MSNKKTTTRADVIEYFTNLTGLMTDSFDAPDGSPHAQDTGQPKRDPFYTFRFTMDNLCGKTRSQANSAAAHAEKMQTEHDEIVGRTDENDLRRVFSGQKAEMAGEQLFVTKHIADLMAEVYENVTGSAFDYHAWDEAVKARYSGKPTGDLDQRRAALEARKAESEQRRKAFG